MICNCHLLDLFIPLSMFTSMLTHNVQQFVPFLSSILIRSFWCLLDKSSALTANKRGECVHTTQRMVSFNFLCPLCSVHWWQLRLNLMAAKFSVFFVFLLLVFWFIEVNLVDWNRMNGRGRKIFEQAENKMLLAWHLQEEFIFGDHINNVSRKTISQIE